MTNGSQRGVNVRLRTLAVLLLCLTLARRSEAQLDSLGFTWGVHGAYPEYVAASFGVSTSHTYSNGDQRGFFMVAEPGLNGGRISIGQLRGFTNGTWSTHLGLLHTWGTPPGTIAGVTYFNTEQRLTVQWFQVGLGFGLRVAGGTSSVGGFALPKRDVAVFLITGVFGAHFAF